MGYDILSVAARINNMKSERDLNLKYSVITDSDVTEDFFCGVTYGVRAENGVEFHDITTEYSLIKCFVDNLNACKIEPEHLKDAVDDFIFEITTVEYKFS